MYIKLNLKIYVKESVQRMEISCFKVLKKDFEYPIFVLYNVHMTRKGTVSREKSSVFCPCVKANTGNSVNRFYIVRKIKT